MPGLVGRFASALLGDDTPPLPPDPRAQPRPFSAADRKFPTPATINLQDQRPVDSRRRAGGPVREDIVRQIIAEALRQGVDPSTALAVGLQETNLGTADVANGTASNPMMLNPPRALLGTKFNPGFPSDTLLGNIDDNQTSRESRDALDREYAVNQSIAHLKTRMGQYPGDPSRGIQAYNGLGQPPGRGQMYGVPAD